MAKHNDIGKEGEKVAREFLVKRGLKIIELNYWRKWGEIDIVAQETMGNLGRRVEIIHFVEVKTTNRDYSEGDIDRWRPEEMIHNNKIKRLKRVIQTYILENDVEDWVFDVLIMYLNKRTRTARCKYIKDIVL